jgi:hypothetical protein
LGDGSDIIIGGTVAETSPGVFTQRADLNDAGLSFTAAYTAGGDHIRIDGQIQDRLMKERGLQITFSLPMEATGWVWGDDIRHTRVVSGSTRYQNTQLLPYGGTFSRYPFASLSGPPGGLSLAAPMDVPRIQYTSYSRAQGYQMTFDLALSPATAKLGPGRATFSFLLYGFDPAWGFRAAAAKYYAIFPQFFVKRVRREGLWFGGIDLSQIPNPSDFGFAFDQEDDAELTTDTMNGSLRFRYLEPWGWWRSFGRNPNKPSYQARVAALLNDAASGTGTWSGAPITTVAQGVLNSSPLDMAGRYHLDAFDHFWHIWGSDGNESYYQNYPTNPDPDLPPPNRGLIARDYEIGHDPEILAKLDGVYLDSLHVHWAWPTLENYRRDHWAVADQPLVFSYFTKQPMLLGLFANYDFVAWLADRLRADDRLLMANIFYDAYPFYAHLLDVLGSEIPDIEDDTMAMIRRTLSYQKPNSYLMQWHVEGGGSRQVITHEQMEAYIKSSLFYGIFPGMWDAGEGPDGTARIYWKDPALYERDRDLYRRFMPLIQTIARAGWEPITQARTDNPAVGVERFGPERSGQPSSRQVFFTVRNSSATAQTYTLTISATALGLDTTQPITVTELVSGATVPITINDGPARISQTIAGSDTQVFCLAGSPR